MTKRGVGCLAGIFVALLAGVLAGFVWLSSLSEPREAPESEAVLTAQIDLPFQVLIPAYLPRIVDRAGVQIDTSQPGPGGEPMIRLVYPLLQALGQSYPPGTTLELREWLPNEQASGLPSDQDVTSTQPLFLRCNCRMLSTEQCTPNEVEVSIGELRALITVSAANALSMQQINVIYDTLGPATNRQQVYSSMQEVPVTLTVPDAEEIPLNAEGIQEVTLVVTPNGYDPVHFAVKRGVPVRFIFRQVGYVSCGNELIFQYGENQIKILVLATQNDRQVFEFIPTQAGEFPFNCPHLIYRGVMTVHE